MSTEDQVREIVVEASRGSKDAEAALYKRYVRFVERRLAAAKRKRNWFWLTELEDAVQDIFVQFFSAIKKGRFHFTTEDELKGFLIRTSFFVAMNLKDKKPRERVFSQFDSQDGDNPIMDLAAFTDNIYAKQNRKDCLKMLYAAVDKLSKNRRDIVVRTLLGQKVRDICATTNRTPASVSGLKFNALKDLKKLLDQVKFLEHCAEAMELLGGSS